jgi:hypothetical protein
MIFPAAKNFTFFVTVAVGVLLVFWWVKPCVFPLRNVAAPATNADGYVATNNVAKASANGDGGLQTVNSAFYQDWQTYGVDVASPANQLKIMRRLSLALCGRIPSVYEIRSFERQPADRQIDDWVSNLLQQTQTSDFLAERLARAWVGVEDGPFLVYRRSRFVQWLSRQIFINRPYDQIVGDLLNSKGTWTDSPAVNFYTRTLVVEEDENNAPNPMLLAGRVTRALIAMRIDCLQCHDDFMDEIYLGDPDSRRPGVQADFHHLAAFFADTRNSFFGIGDLSPQSQPYRYRLMDEANTTVIAPQVPYAEQLLPDTGTLRQRLAQWMTNRKNRPFGRAIVNRMWAIMTGAPLIHPVDNIPLDGQLPHAFEAMVTDFIEHDFNLHRLIRVIAHSNAFSNDSHADFEIQRCHTDCFAVFPMTRLRPTQVARSVLQATTMRPINQQSNILSRLETFDLLKTFVGRFGDAGENEFDHRSETVTQKLLMFNGDMVTRRIADDSWIAKIHHLSPGDAATIESIFLATLTRRPTNGERDFFASQLAQDSAKKQQLVSDLYWSLINSLEFAWNH